MPTAVMIESSEKIRSTTMICRITAVKVAVTALEASPSSPSSDSMDLSGALPDQEQATKDQDQVAAGDLLAEDGEERFDQPDDPGRGPGGGRCA